MELSIPLIPKAQSLHQDWTSAQPAANTAIIRCADGRTETLIYVVFGDDFIAGLRSDRRTWILLPVRATASVEFRQLESSWLPPIRQSTEEARSYLQGLGSIELKVWPVGQPQPLPAAKGTVQGRWLVLSRADDGSAQQLVSFDSIQYIEVVDINAAVADLQGTAKAGVKWQQ